MLLFPQELDNCIQRRLIVVGRKKLGAQSLPRTKKSTLNMLENPMAGKTLGVFLAVILAGIFVGSDEAFF